MRFLGILSAIFLNITFNCFFLNTAQAFEMGVTILSPSEKEGPEILERRFQRMNSLGIAHARIDWEWRSVENTQGHYDWKTQDQLITLANKYKIRLLPIVHYAPDWAIRNKRKKDGVFEQAPSEEFFDAYARFVEASILRYGPSGTAPFQFTPILEWQIWNEPNTSEFWGPSPDAREFARLMKITATRIQNIKKNKGTSSVRIIHAGLSKSDYVFLWHLWNADKNYGNYFDVMAVHPYFFNPAGGVRAIDANDTEKSDPAHAALGFLGSPDDPGYLIKLSNIRLFLDLKGFAKTPLWVTEIGFLARDRFKNMYAIDEKEQAELAAETLCFLMRERRIKNRNSSVERVYWFALDDYPFSDGFGRFGIFREDEIMRPMGKVIMNFTQNKPLCKKLP